MSFTKVCVCVCVCVCVYGYIREIKKLYIIPKLAFTVQKKMVQNEGIPFHFFTGSDKAHQQPDQYFMGQNVIDFLCIPLY